MKLTTACQVNWTAQLVLVSVLVEINDQFFIFPPFDGNTCLTVQFTWTAQHSNRGTPLDYLYWFIFAVKTFLPFGQYDLAIINFYFNTKL